MAASRSWKSKFDSALDIIRLATRPFIQRTLDAPDSSGKSGWERAQVSGPPLIRSIQDWSSDECLRILLSHHSIFDPHMRNTSAYPHEATKLSWVRKGWLKDLLLLRNKAAHPTDVPFTDEECERFLFVGATLLRDMGSDEEAAKLDLLRRDDAASASTSDRQTELVVHRIRQTDEPEFGQFVDLVGREFHDTVRASEESFEKWVQDIEVCQAEEPPCHEVFLVAQFAHNERLNKAAVALLYASHFPTLGTLFISYIAIDESFANELWSRGEFACAIQIRTISIPLLLTSLAQITEPSPAVLFEIQRGEKNSSLRRMFRAYAARYFDRKLYLIDVDYVHPELDEHSQELTFQDLLYMPSAIHQEMIDNNSQHLPRQEVISLLDLVYRQMYAKNFDRTPKADIYRLYVGEIFEQVRSGLPALVPVRLIESRQRQC